MHTHRSQQIICTRTDPNSSICLSTRTYPNTSIIMQTHRSQHKHIHTYRSQYKHSPLFLFSSLPTPLSLSTPPSLELPLVYLGGGATLQRGGVRAGREDAETLMTAVPALRAVVTHHVVRHALSAGTAREHRWK